MLGEEFREARVSMGLSQQQVADAVHVSRPVYGRIERGTLQHLPLVLSARVASVLGLDLFVRLYPGGKPIRDAAQAARLARVLSHVGPPLTYRTEVPLPQRPGQPTESRGWDALILGHNARTAVEMEARIRDMQAMTRRHAIKRRDDPVDSFLLVVADTRTNRGVLREYPELLVELPRLKSSRVLAQLRAGRHPPSGVILV